jgi:hypothetical protein
MKGIIRSINPYQAARLGAGQIDRGRRYWRYAIWHGPYGTEGVYSVPHPLRPPTVAEIAASELTARPEAFDLIHGPGAARAYLAALQGQSDN